MRKVLLFAGIFFFVLMLIGLHLVGFAHQDFSEVQQDGVLSCYVAYDENIYTAKHDVSNTQLVDVSLDIKEFFSKLPQDTIERFRDKGWKIIISSQKPSYIEEAELVVAYGIGGNTNYNLRIIYIYLNTAMPQYIFSDFVHEFGHFEDWEKGYVSNSIRFRQLMDDNRYYVPYDEFADENYHLTSEKEFFACCYKDYFLYGDRLAQEAPLVYDYIDRVVKYGNSPFISFYLRIFRG